MELYNLAAYDYA